MCRVLKYLNLQIISAIFLSLSLFGNVSVSLSVVISDADARSVSYPLLFLPTPVKSSPSAPCTSGTCESQYALYYVCFDTRPLYQSTVTKIDVSLSFYPGFMHAIFIEKSCSFVCEEGLRLFRRVEKRCGEWGCELSLIEKRPYAPPLWIYMTVSNSTWRQSSTSLTCYLIRRSYFHAIQ
jgi:hypothetical protein